MAAAGSGCACDCDCDLDSPLVFGAQPVAAAYRDTRLSTRLYTYACFDRYTRRKLKAPCRRYLVVPASSAETWGIMLVRHTRARWLGACCSETWAGDVVARQSFLKGRIACIASSCVGLLVGIVADVVCRGVLFVREALLQLYDANPTITLARILMLHRQAARP